MTSNRKKPSVAFWITVVAVMVLAYPLSWGPACWFRSNILGDADWAMTIYFTVYGPLLWMDAGAPKWIQDATTRYCNLLW